MSRLESLNLVAGNSVVMPSREYLLQPESASPIEIVEGRYLVRLALTPEEIDAALKLRFEVFNLEIGEGLDASFETGRDVDEFDAICHHLIVIDRDENQVVGTYRCQTGEMAAAKGFYSASEFNLSHIPSSVQLNAVELGRACVSRPHRNTQVLFLLWKGLAAYVTYSRKRYLFGCCSLTSQDEREGMRVFETLKASGHLHPKLHASPMPGFECDANNLGLDQATEVNIPKLFRIYLRFGARVCGPPAIDRLFKTIDFLVLFDIEEMGEQWRRVFFGV